MFICLSVCGLILCCRFHWKGQQRCGFKCIKYINSLISVHSMESLTFVLIFILGQSKVERDRTEFWHLTDLN